jgi:hypothetical protein
MKARGLHNKMAKAICPPGTYRKLCCMTCGKVEKAGPNGIAKYLRVGWPKCCDTTMELS